MDQFGGDGLNFNFDGDNGGLEDLLTQDHNQDFINPRKMAQDELTPIEELTDEITSLTGAPRGSLQGKGINRAIETYYSKTQKTVYKKINSFKKEIEGTPRICLNEKLEGESRQVKALLFYELMVNKDHSSNFEIF